MLNRTVCMRTGGCAAVRVCFRGAVTGSDVNGLLIFK